MITLVTVVLLMIYCFKYYEFKQTTYHKITHNGFLSTRLNKGRNGEYLTYIKLRGYEKKGGKFLFNCYLPRDNGETTEIDVLLINEDGIYAFESKNYSGWIFGDEKSKNWTQTLPQGKGRSHKEYFLNPIKQNQLHIKWLTKMVGEEIPIHSVIVFPERCTLKKVTVNSPDIFVIKRNRIAAIVRKISSQKTNKLNNEKVKAIYEQLYPYTQVSDLVKDQHVKNIQNNLNKDNQSPVTKSISQETTLEKTLKYYNQNASQFASGTQMVDFTETQEKFISKLKPDSFILDFGCGSGRDTKYFIDLGFQVEATDGSIELCKLATEFTGIQVKQMTFADLEEMSKYDAIWACASILHLPKKELIDVIRKMVTAINSDGIIYTSFKYGTFEGERNGRYFTDMTEDAFAEMISNNMELEIEEQWITSDVRPGRGEEKWINLILRKK